MGSKFEVKNLKFSPEMASKVFDDERKKIESRLYKSILAINGIGGVPISDL